MQLAPPLPFQACGRQQPRHLLGCLSSLSPAFSRRTPLRALGHPWTPLQSFCHHLFQKFPGWKLLLCSSLQSLVSHLHPDRRAPPSAGDRAWLLQVSPQSSEARCVGVADSWVLGSVGRQMWVSSSLLGVVMSCPPAAPSTQCPRGCQRTPQHPCPIRPPGGARTLMNQTGAPVAPVLPGRALRRTPQQCPRARLFPPSSVPSPPPASSSSLPVTTSVPCLPPSGRVADAIRANESEKEASKELPGDPRGAGELADPGAWTNRTRTTHRGPNRGARGPRSRQDGGQHDPSRRGHQACATISAAPPTRTPGGHPGR